MLEGRRPLTLLQDRNCHNDEGLDRLKTSLERDCLLKHSGSTLQEAPLVEVLLTFFRQGSKKVREVVSPNSTVIIQLSGLKWSVILKSIIPPMSMP